MKKVALVITILFIFISSTDCLAQDVTNVIPSQTGSNIRLDYTITGAKYNQTFNVSVFISNDGGTTYKGPLKEVEGDVGDVYGGGKKIIQWNAFEDEFDFSGDLVFDVRLEVYEDQIKNKFIIGYTGNSSAPLGLTVGKAGKVAWYISARLNPDYFLESSYSTNGVNITDYDGRGYYEFTGETKTARASFTGGLGFRIIKDVVYLYVGGGYGVKRLLWETEDFSYESSNSLATEYAEYTDFTYAGYEVESGLLFSLNKVFFAFGASSVQSKRLDASFSFGLSF